MFEQDVLNDEYVRAATTTHRKGSIFPHTAGLAFRVLEGAIKATKCPRRDGTATEHVISAPGPGGCSIFITHPDSDYVVLEDAKIFAFPRELAPLVFNKLLEQNYCVQADKGHITLPPPKTILPNRQEPVMTRADVPAAKLRSRTPPEAFTPVDPRHPTLAFPYNAPKIEVAPKHRTRIGLPFPTTHVNGEAAEILPTTLRSEPA